MYSIAKSKYVMYCRLAVYLSNFFIKIEGHFNVLHTRIVLYFAYSMYALA